MDAGGGTILDALRIFEQKGYRAQFRVEPSGKMRCLTCGVLRDPAEITLRGTGRSEGQTDPSDESVVVALECACGARGTEVFTFGSGAEAAEMEAFRGLRRPNQPASSP